VLRFWLAFAVAVTVVAVSATQARFRREGGVAALSCGPDASPSQATAQGYTCEVFWSNWQSVGNINDIDVNDTRASGFNWYVHNLWPGLGGGHTGWNNVQTTPLGDITYSSGNGVSIDPSNNNSVTATNPNSWNMQSCATNGTANQYIGTAIPGGFYVEVGIHSITPDGQQGGNNWWPVVWTQPIEFLAAPNAAPSSVTFSEVDIFENIADPYPRYAHYWTGNDDSLTDHPTQFGTYNNTFTSAGALIIKAANNGGVGVLRAYKNGSIDPNNVDVTWTPGDGHFSVIETDHHCFTMTSGYHQPMVLSYFRVWGPPS
jgi:hypothetical protein